MLTVRFPQPDTILYHQHVNQDSIWKNFAAKYPPDSLILNILQKKCLLDSTQFLKLCFITQFVIPNQIAAHSYFFNIPLDSVQTYEPYLLLLLKYRIFQANYYYFLSEPTYENQIKTAEIIKDGLFIAKLLSKYNSQYKELENFLKKQKRLTQPYFYERVES